MHKLSNLNIVVGLLQVRAEPWKSIYEEGQLKTWIKECPPEIQIINLYGKTPNKTTRFVDIVHEKMRWSKSLQGPIHQIDRSLNRFFLNLDAPKWKINKSNSTIDFTVDFPSIHLTLPIVEKAFFEFFLEFTDADFLYMSNTSSYVNLKLLGELVNNLQRKGIYSGTTKEFSNFKFASGANRLLSRDVVEYVLNNFSQWDFSFMEDVSMGKLLNGKKLLEFEIPSVSISSIEEALSMDEIVYRKTPHFRLKSGSLNSRLDSKLMHIVHSSVLQKNE